MIKQLTIIGLGLMGGSIARAIKPTGFCEKIIAYDPQIENVKQAYNSRIIDGYEKNLNVAVKDADLIIIATPLNAFPTIFSGIQPYIGENTVITDVCSVKSETIKLAKKFLGSHWKNFVPGHPIAGAEKSGFGAAQGDLFKNRCVVLTPLSNTRPTAIKLVKQFWQWLGTQVAILEPKNHDKFLAVTSHLPQVLAYAFMNYFATKTNLSELSQYAGNGFKDFTRIAASNPKWWVDICIVNNKVLSDEIKKFQKQLTQIQKLIKKNNKKKLEKIFTTAKTAREKM